MHSLHHKSYNPTAFSGTNMHPVESTLYYSAALIPVAFGLHPVHALGVIVDCAMGAWLGHDGFQVYILTSYRYDVSKHFSGLEVETISTCFITSTLTVTTEPCTSR